MMVPGSLQAARAASASMPAEEQETVDGMLCRTMLPARLRELGVQAVVDANPAGREVHLGEGDMLLLDPMTTQCVSRPRHQLLARCRLTNSRCCRQFGQPVPRGRPPLRVLFYLL